MRPMPALALGAAAAVTALVVLARVLGPEQNPAPLAAPAAPAAAPSGPPPCPRGMLPDDGVCLPLPSGPSPAPERRDDAAAIELLPDRPADYGAYRLPPSVQRAEPAGLGALLHVAPGAPVEALALEGQVGAAELRRDEGTPRRLVALYTVRRADSERRYLVLLDHLRLELSNDVHRLDPGARIGRVVPTPAGSVLALSVRQLRQSTDPTLPTAELLGDAHSIASDPRNVLPRLR